MNDIPTSAHHFYPLPDGVSDATCAECRQVFPVVTSLDNDRGILIPLSQAICVNNRTMVAIPKVVLRDLIRKLGDWEDELALSEWTTETQTHATVREIAWAMGQLRTALYGFAEPDTKKTR